MTINLDQFSNQKYINLETYKKDGTSVKTPVWFVIDNEILYIVTQENTGKVKRLKNNQNVRIVPCGFKGKEKGEWTSGKATPLSEEESDKIIKLRRKKYGFFGRLVDFLKSQKNQLIAFGIKLE